MPKQTAKQKWNSEADEYNQWDTLGQDEKDELIKKNSSPMKALIEIDFTIDGETPSCDKLKDAVFKIVSESGYIGSESVDGTDKWGLEIQEIKVFVAGQIKSNE